MKWPWIVSGNRHRRLLRKYRELKRELAELRADPLSLVAEALPDPTSPDLINSLDSSGRLTAAAMKARFRRDTQQPRVN